LSRCNTSRWLPHAFIWGTQGQHPWFVRRPTNRARSLVQMRESAYHREVSHTIGQIATRHLVSISQDAGIQSAIDLMLARHIGALVAVDDTGQPVGVLTETDALRGRLATGSTVKSAMSPTLISLDAQTAVAVAARLMANAHLHRLLVTENGAVVGLLSLTDMARLMGEVGLRDDELPQIQPLSQQLDLSSPREVFSRSLVRCSKDLADRFYERFVHASPEIERIFARIDMNRQKGAILKAFHLAVDVADNKPGALALLAEQAEIHDRRHRNIRPDLYDIWMSCLLETLRECDPEWTPVVETAWRIVLGNIIAYMVRRH
jgi:CBS domain-containing protein/hemoglobin-like flavoprotein